MSALLQHLPSYLGFSYLGRGVSLHGCSSKAQPLLLTLDEGYLLTAAPPDIQRGMAPLGPPAPTQPPLLGHGVAHPFYNVCILPPSLCSKSKRIILWALGTCFWSDCASKSHSVPLFSHHLIHKIEIKVFISCDICEV